jgi:hypothetical protein
LASVNAPEVPLPDAVTLYPFVLVLLQTQTFWAFAASTLGSAFVNATSLNPLMRTRFAIDAEIDTEPVEVAPRLP